MFPTLLLWCCMSGLQRLQRATAGYKSYFTMPSQPRRFRRRKKVALTEQQSAIATEQVVDYLSSLRLVLNNEGRSRKLAIPMLQ